MHAANAPGAHSPEQLRYLGYDAGETGCGGSKGSCKKPCTCLERSFNWLNFFSVHPRRLAHTRTPEWAQTRVWGCVRISEGWGCLHEFTPVSLGLRCKCKLYVENVTLLALSNGRSWVKWTSARTARSRLLTVSWDCTCKFACLEHDAFAAGTHSRLHSCLPTPSKKQQLGLVLYPLISRVWHTRSGKDRGAVLPNCGEPSTAPGSPILLWAPLGQQLAAVASPGPPGGLFHMWGIKPRRPLCFGNIVSTGVSFPCDVRRAWCLWCGLEGESGTGTAKPRQQRWGSAWQVAPLRWL